MSEKEKELSSDEMEQASGGASRVDGLRGAGAQQKYVIDHGGGPIDAGALDPATMSKVSGGASRVEGVRGAGAQQKYIIDHGDDVLDVDPAGKSRRGPDPLPPA